MLHLPYRRTALLRCSSSRSPSPWRQAAAPRPHRPAAVLPSRRSRGPRRCAGAGPPPRRSPTSRLAPGAVLGRAPGTALAGHCVRARRSPAARRRSPPVRVASRRPRPRRRPPSPARVTLGPCTVCPAAGAAAVAAHAVTLDTVDRRARPRQHRRRGPRPRPRARSPKRRSLARRTTTTRPTSRHACCRPAARRRRPCGGGAAASSAQRAACRRGRRRPPASSCTAGGAPLARAGARSATSPAQLRPRAAKAYADKYALSYNPTYTRFSADCANFGSQTMFAGGYPKFGSAYESGWWYDKNGTSAPGDDTYSHSLDRGHPTSRAPGTSSYTDVVSSISDVGKGDFVYYDWTGDGSWDHVAELVGTNTSGQKVVDAHTTDHYHVFWKLGTSRHALPVRPHTRHRRRVTGTAGGRRNGHRRRAGMPARLLPAVPARPLPAGPPASCPPFTAPSRGPADGPQLTPLHDCFQRERVRTPCGVGHGKTRGASSGIERRQGGPVPAREGRIGRKPTRGPARWRRTRGRCAQVGLAYPGHGGGPASGGRRGLSGAARRARSGGLGGAAPGAARARRWRRRRGHPAGRVVVGDGQSRHPGRRPADASPTSKPPTAPSSKPPTPTGSWVPAHAPCSPSTKPATPLSPRACGESPTTATSRSSKTVAPLWAPPSTAGRSAQSAVLPPSPSATLPPAAASSPRRRRASSAVSMTLRSTVIATDDECFSHDCADGMVNGYRIDEAAASAGVRALAELSEAVARRQGLAAEASGGCAPRAFGCSTPVRDRHRRATQLALADRLGRLARAPRPGGLCVPACRHRGAHARRSATRPGPRALPALARDGPEAAVAARADRLARRRARGRAPRSGRGRSLRCL